MANISRDSFDPSKNYDKVILQQGQPVVDYDYNEMQDILRHRMKKIIKDIFGNGAIQEGFKIESIPDNNNFTIKKGIVYNEGFRAYQETDRSVTDYGVTLNTPTENRTDKVYLKIFLLEIDSSSDPDIRHSAFDGTGIEPSVRERVDFEVNVAEGEDIPEDSSNEFHFLLAEIEREGGNDEITEEMITDERDIMSPELFAEAIYIDSEHGDTVEQVVEYLLQEFEDLEGDLSGYSTHVHSGEEGDAPNIPWDNITEIPSDFTPSTHDNTAHSENYATEGGDYENLRARATTKEDVGLSNVKNEEQATKTELNSHKSEDAYEAHNGVVAQEGGKNIWVQSNEPTALEVGDIWIKTE